MKFDGTYLEKMYDLGIGDEAISYCEIENFRDGQGFQFPMAYPPKITGEQVQYQYTERVRFFPDYLLKNPSSPRMLSLDTESREDEKLPPFYTPNWAHLRESVLAADGDLEMFEGETDVMARIQTGRFNVIGVIGVSHIPSDFGFHLKSIGVKRVLYYPDLDYQGWDAAEHVGDVLKKSGISLEAFAYTASVNGKRIKDFRDVWKAFEYNIDAVNEYLKSLKKIKLFGLAASERARDKSGYFSDNFYSEIEDKLGVDLMSPNSWSNLVKCPCVEHEEDDTKPGANWHNDRHILRCFKCGINYSARQVAEALDIHWQKYINDKKGVKTPWEEELTGEGAANEILGSDIRVAASLLQVTANTDYDILDPKEFMYPMTLALDRHAERLAGASSGLYPPMPFPFTSKGFELLGGNCVSIAPPTVISVMGVSGGYKSSLMASVAMRMSSMGYHGIVWSPEWSPEKHADRAMQQFGGLSMTNMSLLERYYYEQNMIEAGKLSVDSPSKFGRKPSDARIQEVLSKVNNLHDVMVGDIVFINQFGANILEVLAMLKSAYKKMAAIGKTPSYFIMDYIQMAIPPRGWRDWTANDTITYTKALTLQLGLVTWVVSQVRKSDTDLVAEGTTLGKGAGLNFRDDQVNLALTISPTDESLNSHKVIVCNVTKNSTGTTGLVNLYVHPTQLSVLDTLR